ncbi:MAG: S41 family peptidase [Planctomycetota bacterium]
MKTSHLAGLTAVLLLLLLAGPAEPKGRKGGTDYVKDARFALEEIEKACGHFFRAKDIDWKKVSAEILKEAKKVKTDQDHLVLLCRIVGKLEDGHASVRPLTEKAKAVKWPFAKTVRQSGPGMFWCRVGKRIYVKNCWSAAEDCAIKPGMEVVKVDGLPAMKWLDGKIAEMREFGGYSTDEQAFYAACHWGLAADRGTGTSYELKKIDGKRKKVTVTRRKAPTTPVGPAIFPEGLSQEGRQHYGKLPSGFGYIHLRDCPGSLPAQIDKMLGEIGHVPGLILDCRANGGGGFDHDAVLGQFVPKGHEMPRAKAYKIKSHGENPYGGPIVVIVDAGCRSAGETMSGMFKEDGRGYMIGESHTAGMSSSKKTIPLPSGMFAMYVSVRSNKARFNGGRGIEGVGVIPHEIVPYDPKDLAKGVDTQIRRAEELLKDFPQGKVPYRPKKYGWKK